MSEPPSEKELPLLKKFREAMKEELPRYKLEQDHYLLRWLRARDLDVDKAIIMLRTSLAWRKERRVEEVLTKPIPLQMATLINGTFGGIDKLGHLVLGMPAGEWDMRKPLDDGHRDELVGFMILALEILDVTMETMWEYKFPFETQYPQTKFTVIVDLKNFTYAKFAHKKSVEALIEVVKLYEANYPETLARCFVINSPRIFSMLFAIIRPFLSENTVNKISIHDSNEGNWKKEIAQMVDPNQLPVKYGGNNINNEILI